MNEEKLKRFTYLINGDMDPIYLAIDCLEQPEYMLTKKYNVDASKIFTDDINFCYIIDKQDNLHSVVRNFLIAIDKIFTLNEIRTSDDNFFKAIRDTIDNDDIVIFKTMFDLVYPYCWYNEKSDGTHDMHCSTIIDYDSKYYYFIDSPYVLTNHNQSYINNKQVSMMEHEKLHTALKKLCILYAPKFNKNAYDEIISLNDLVKAMILNYRTPQITENEDRIMFSGELAYTKFLNSLKNDDYYKLYDSSLADFFPIHLILSRRILLKQQLEINQYNLNSIEYLEKSIKAFDDFKILLIKNNLKPIDDFRKLLVDQFEYIIECDTILINKLEKGLIT